MSRGVIFRYIRTARDEARDAFAMTAILIVFAVPFVVIGWWLTGLLFKLAGGWAWLLPAPGFLFLLAGVVFLLIAIFTFAVGIYHRLRGGQWEVAVTDRELLWQDLQKGSASFRIPLGEIVALEKVTTQTVKKGRGKSKRRTAHSYRMISNNGEITILHPPSKMDMPAFVAALEAAGVTARQVTRHVEKKLASAQ